MHSYTHVCCNDFYTSWQHMRAMNVYLYYILNHICFENYYCLAIYQLMVDIYKFPKLFMLRSFNGISLMPLPDLIQATLSLMTFSFSLTERSLYPPTFMI